MPPVWSCKDRTGSPEFAILVVKLRCRGLEPNAAENGGEWESSCRQTASQTTAIGGLSAPLEITTDKNVWQVKNRGGLLTIVSDVPITAPISKETPFCVYTIHCCGRVFKQSDDHNYNSTPANVWTRESDPWTFLIVGLRGADESCFGLLV